MSPSRLDLRRLKTDVSAAPPRPSGLAPGGRPATGLMEAVREHLDAILAMKEGGASWGTIAAALSAQGFVTANGRAISGQNLTGIISSIRRQKRRRDEAAATRESRRDLGGHAPSRPSTKHSSRGARSDLNPAPPTTRRLVLSPDLVRSNAPAPHDPKPSEEALRRESLARLQDLIKKD